MAASRHDDGGAGEKSSVARIAEEFAAGFAAPLGMLLAWQLQDSSSWLRVKLAEIVDRAREIREEAEEWSIRARVNSLIHETSTTEDTQP